MLLFNLNYYVIILISLFSILFRYDPVQNQKFEDTTIITLFIFLNLVLGFELFLKEKCYSQGLAHIFVYLTPIFYLFIFHKHKTHIHNTFLHANTQKYIYF